MSFFSLKKRNSKEKKVSAKTLKQSMMLWIIWWKVLELAKILNLDISKYDLNRFSSWENLYKEIKQKLKELLNYMVYLKKTNQKLEEKVQFLEKIIDKLLRENEQLREENEQLRKHNKELFEFLKRLNKNEH